MSDYNKKYAKEKYKRVFTDIQKNVAETFENKLKKLGFSRSLVFKTAIDLLNNEDEYFLEKIQNKQDEKEMTLAQLINKMKESSEKENIISFIDEMEYYKITIIDTDDLINVSTGEKEDIYQNRNRKVVLQKG